MEQTSSCTCLLDHYQAHGAVVLAPSSRYLASSPPLSDFLSANSPNLGSDPLTSVYERADVPDYSTYASILNSGVKPFLLPNRLNRKEAMGIVDLVKGWRGAREGELDAPLCQRTFSTHPLTSYCLPSQPSTTPLFWSGWSLQMETPGSLCGHSPRTLQSDSQSILSPENSPFLRNAQMSKFKKG